MELDEILSQLKKGDYSHFQEFYNQTSKSLFFTALMILKDEHLANDIVQESYVKMFQNIDSLDPKQKINYNLTTIARNLSINEYNKRKREITDEEMLLLKTGTYHFSKLNDECEAILSVLDEDIEREIVTYHVLFEYKFREISQLVDKPLGTVLWIYNKAIKKLQERVIR